MTPHTWSRCKARRVGVRSKPAFQPSPPRLPTSPLHQRHQMNFDRYIPCPQSLIKVCAVKGFSAIITGKKGHWVQATKLFSLCVKCANASTKQFVLCPPCVHQGGINQQEWRGFPWEGEQTDTLGMRDKVIFVIPGTLFSYIIWCSLSQDTQTQAHQWIQLL